MRRATQVAIVVVVLFAAAQLVRPPRANPHPDGSHPIQDPSKAPGLAALLDRSCGDCHSNRTASGWFAQVAPVSWLMSYGVGKARKAVNFSEWSAYSPEQQRQLLAASCRDVTAGRMPGPWTLVRPEARLSARDREIVCAAAGQVGGTP